MSKRKSNILKQLLTTVSAVAVLSGNDAAMGTALQTNSGGITLSTPGNTRVSGGGAMQGMVSGDSLDIITTTAIHANVAGFNLQALRLTGSPGELMVSHNLTLGSVAGLSSVPSYITGRVLPISVHSSTLNLSGTSSAAFATGPRVPINRYDLTNLVSVDSTINIANNVTVNGTIRIDTNSTINFAGSGTVTKSIQDVYANSLSAVNFNGPGTVNLGGVRAATLTINNASVIVTAGSTNGTLNYAAPGSFASNGGFTGNVDFAGNAGTFTLANDKVIGGSITSTGTAAGILNFLGAGTVTGAIGGAAATTALSAINLNDAGAVNLGNGNTVRALAITINKGAVVTVGGAVTSSGGGISFGAGGGTLNARAGITGTVTLSNGGKVNVSNAAFNGDVSSLGGTTTDSILTVTNQTINGAINLTNGGSVVTTGANGTIGGAITLGNAAAITASAVIVTGVAGVTFAVGGGTLNANNGLIGKVDLSNGGKVNVSNAAYNGDVSSQIGTTTASILTANNQAVTGAINLTNGGSVVTTGVGGMINGGLTLGKGAVITASALITTGAPGVTFAAGGGTLTADAGLIGNVALSNGGNVIITNAILNGDITSPGSGTLSATHGASDNVTSANNSVITFSGGNIGGDLSVTGNSRFTGATSNAPGTVLIDSTNATGSTIQDATVGVVTVNRGSLIARNVVDINVDAVNGYSVVTVNNIGGNAVLSNGGGLIVSENIIGTVEGNGTLTLNGVGPLQTITGAVGGLTPLTQVTNIEFAGGNVTFTNPILNATNLDFTTATPGITVNALNADLGGANITGVGAHTIAVGADQNITGNISAFGNIQVAGVKTININTNNFLAGITAAAPSEVTAKINNDGLTFSQLGDSTTPLLGVEFNGNANVTGATYADTAEITVGKKVAFGGSLTANDLTLTGNGSMAEFADGVIVGFTITPAIAGEGIVDFTGSAYIQKEIGNVAAVNFNANDYSKEIKLFANIGAMANFKKARIILNNDINMTAGASFNSTEIDLGNDKKLTISGGDVTLTGDVVVKTIITGGALGNIEFDVEGSNIDLSSINSLTISVDDGGSSTEGIYNYALMATKSGNIQPFDVSKVHTDNAGGNLVRWVASYANGAITLSDGEFITIPPLLPPSQPGEAPTDLPVIPLLPIKEPRKGNFWENFDELTKAQETEVMDRLSNSTAANNAALIIDAINDATNQVASRMRSLISAMPIPTTMQSSLQAAFSSNSLTGVAAGDEVERYGIWINPFYSQHTQSKRNLTTAGHRAISNGITAGFDTKANEDVVVGAATTYINTDVSHNDFKKGDKTKIDSLVFTVYGLRQMSNNCFLQGIANFGLSKVLNGDIRGYEGNKQIAVSKYTSMSFSGEIVGGYNYLLNQRYMITPMVGLGYVYFNDTGSSETGTTNQNLDIIKKSSNKVEGILGLRIAGAPYIVNNMALTSEVHAFVRQALSINNADVDVRVKGINRNLAKKISSQSLRTFVSAGTTVNARYNTTDYGAGYDLTLARKYIGHQGTLKLRVNF